MARFVRLTTPPNADATLLPVADIIEVWGRDDFSIVRLINRPDGAVGLVREVVVLESLDEIERLLNGEPAAEPRAPLTAGPRGWETAETGGGS